MELVELNEARLLVVTEDAQLFLKGWSVRKVAVGTVFLSYYCLASTPRLSKFEKSLAHRKLYVAFEKNFYNQTLSTNSNLPEP